jgi:transcriptional regulator of acetoin/glycerol metabolism
MIKNDNSNNCNFLKDWENFFVNNKKDDLKVRDVILNSWKRSIEYGLNPFNLNKYVLSKNELKQKRNINQNLINISKPYMDNLHKFVDGAGFVIILTDKSGLILETVTDQSIKKQAEETKLIPGATRDEMIFGTNAIGTCLYENMPIQMVGAEHFYRKHQNWTCSAAPIHGIDGNIIGCLDISGPMEKVHPHTLGMIVAAVDGIEKEFKLKHYLTSLNIKNKQMGNIIDTMSDGLIFIDKDKKVRLFNPLILDFFNLNEDKFRNKDIMKIDLFCNDIIEEMFTSSNIVDREIFLTINGKSHNFNLNTSIIYRDSNELEGVLVILKESKKINRLVNKVSGSEAHFNFNNLLGKSEKFKECIEIAKLSSKTNSNIILLGESGTGKELFAQAIHNHSDRKNGPFISINCGALPRGLIESELFGYEGGSFTGSKKNGRPGKFELADGGTIFLDEIGDTPLDVQVTLLRVLQNKEVTRIGGSKSKKIDVRVISATNKNLLEEIKSNSFRADLFYRINVFSINIPPLRERKDDIIILLEYFIKEYSLQSNQEIKNLSLNAKKFLVNYNWPGNVRELENVVERTVYTTTKNLIEIYNLPKYISEFKIENDFKDRNEERNNDSNIYNDSLSISDKKNESKKVTKSEKEKIIEILIKNKGNATKATENLGFSRRTLYRKIKKYEINIDNYR